MASYTGEKQALRYNAIFFYGSLVLTVISLLLAVLAPLTVYILARALPIPSSPLSESAWLNFLLRGVPLGLSPGFFVSAAVRFWREVGKALEIWDRQLAVDRLMKVTRPR